MKADYVELANTQYYGWAWHNREQLMPSRSQVERAEQVTNDFRRRVGERIRVYFVVPDYFENRPKPCMNGLGSIFLTVSPDGTALPCHAARMLPGMEFPNVRTSSVAAIWRDSAAFNRFRGDGWMKEPCRSCPEKAKDFGGCRCQAYLMTGDPANADPVCAKSPHRPLVDAALARAERPHVEEKPVLIFRDARNSRTISGCSG
jgi:pyrroloquinoline quinone biosynthesis protein E